MLDTKPDTTRASQIIMEKLRAGAAKDTSGRRSETLDRLEAACSAIISGEAYQLARKHNFSTNRFRPSRRRFVAEDVDSYVKLRRSLEGSNASWTGPTASFLRADKDLNEYILAIQSENFGDRTQSKSSRKKTLDKIIDEIPSLTDRLELREALDHGTRAHSSLTKARLVVKKVARIDLDKIDPSMSVDEILAQSAGKLGPVQQGVIAKLLRRLTDPHILGEIGLIFKGGRIRMGFAPGTELVAPDELAILAEISEFKLPDRS